MISRSLNRKVWLKSGGYLIIDQTEALTAIDVNSGSYVGSRSLEDTTLDINLEAVQEIGNQLRLRNIRGIIVLDFIDMENAKTENASIVQWKIFYERIVLVQTFSKFLIWV